MKIGDIIIAGLIALCAAAAALFLFTGSGEDLTAVIKRDGDTLYTVDLRSLAGSTTYEIDGMTITAEPGRIRVQSSDCRDKTCVNTGWLTRAGASAVCLPNHVEIVITGDGGGYDAVAR